MLIGDMPQLRDHFGWQVHGFSKKPHHGVIDPADVLVEVDSREFGRAVAEEVAVATEAAGDRVWDFFATIPGRLEELLSRQAGNRVLAVSGRQDYRRPGFFHGIPIFAEVSKCPDDDLTDGMLNLFPLVSHSRSFLQAAGSVTAVDQPLIYAH